MHSIQENSQCVMFELPQGKTIHLATFDEDIADSHYEMLETPPGRQFAAERNSRGRGGDTEWFLLYNIAKRWDAPECTRDAWTRSWTDRLVNIPLIRFKCFLSFDTPCIPATKMTQADR